MCRQVFGISCPDVLGRVDGASMWMNEFVCSLAWKAPDLVPFPLHPPQWSMKPFTVFPLKHQFFVYSGSGRVQDNNKFLFIKLKTNTNLKRKFRPTQQFLVFFNFGSVCLSCEFAWVNREIFQQKVVFKCFFLRSNVLAFCVEAQNKKNGASPGWIWAIPIKVE